MADNAGPSNCSQQLDKNDNRVKDIIDLSTISQNGEENRQLVIDDNTYPSTSSQQVDKNEKLVIKIINKKIILENIDAKHETFNCCYGKIYEKKEADEIFKQLEDEIEYMTPEQSAVTILGKIR